MEEDRLEFTPAELKRAREVKTFLNEGAYDDDAVILGAGESEAAAPIAARVDTYLGDRVENLMRPENVSVSGGGGGRSGRRARKKNNKETESQERERTLRSDQEYELLRPMLVAGRVSEAAHRALYGDEYSVGEMMDIVGRAILEHGSFDAMREKIGIRPRGQVA